MEIIQLPSDVVNSSEHVEFSLEELHCVAISLRWDVTLLVHLSVLEVCHAELPQIVHSVLSVFSSEEVDILPVSGSCTTAPWRGQCVVEF